MPQQHKRQITNIKTKLQSSAVNLSL